MTTPVYDAIAIARLSVEAALAPLVRAQHNNSGEARLYWFKPPAGQPPLPYVVHQTQDRGGLPAHFLNIGAWAGLWAVKVLANSAALAEEWLAAIDGGMDSLALPSGYTGYSIQADYEQPLVLPPDQDVWQSGAIWRIRITRS